MLDSVVPAFLGVSLYLSPCRSRCDAVAAAGVIKERKSKTFTFRALNCESEKNFRHPECCLWPLALTTDGSEASQMSIVMHNGTTLKSAVCHRFSDSPSAAIPPESIGDRFSGQSRERVRRAAVAGKGEENYVRRLLGKARKSIKRKLLKKY